LADKKNEPVVVIGLGRFGTALALELTREGTEVLAIDSRSRVVQDLTGQLAHVVTADATDLEALNQLGVPDFYRAVVAIGGDLEASVLTTSLLMELEIEDIWAKAVSLQHGRILERMGAHHVVFPEHDMGERIAHLVSGGVLDYVELGRDFAVVQTHAPRELVGTTLDDTELRERFNVTAVGIKRQGEDFDLVPADTVLLYDDDILVAGKIRDIAKFTDRV
jgi:trk system potassium uptake protein TrkA